MIKRVVVVAIISAACVASILFGATLFFNKAVIFRVNGEKVESHSIKDLELELEEKELAKYQAVDGLSNFLSVKLDLASITDCNPLQYFTMRDAVVKCTVTVKDTDALEAYIDCLNQNRSRGSASEIILDGGRYSIKRGEPNEQLDVQKILSAIEYREILALEDVLVTDTDYTEKKRLVAKANKLLDYKLNYGKCSFSPQPDEIVFDKKVTIDLDKFSSRVLSDLKDSYNSVGNPVQFKNHLGEIMNVSGGTWGKEVDSTKELESIKGYVSKLDNTVHEPSFSLDCDESIGDTFVEISITDQHVWFVKNGMVTKDSACVTGKAGVHDTPNGVYYVMERMNGKTLRGNDYETWVNKWIRLTWSGIGLHDASWRNNFGGEIYKSNGSHGCINLPYDFAAYLLNEVKTGMPVVIY